MALRSERTQVIPQLKSELSQSESTSSESFTCAKLLIQCLETEGVSVIFGLPGEQNEDFALALSNSRIKLVLVRHEQAAAFMAQVYARLTRIPGVCFGTLGPGATNFVTGVADANLNKASLVVLTGQADSKRLHKESQQNIDIVAMFKPLTKWNSTIRHVDVTPEVVRKAFKLALAEKPGACHIELPEDIASQAASEDVRALEATPCCVESIPSANAINSVWKILSESKRPVVLAGNGVLRSEASEQLTRFCSSTRIPVVTTFMAKGAVPRALEQCIFTVGLATGDYNNDVIDNCDLLLAVGYDLVEYSPQMWNSERKRTIVHIDLAAAEVDDHYQPVAEAVGDIKYTLEQLNARATQCSFQVETAYYLDVRCKMEDDFASMSRDDSKGRVKPQKALWDIRSVLRPDDILVSDVGAHMLWIARYYQCDRPNTCFISNGLESMGFGLPGAIGAKLACPSKRVLAVCGDGGFMMNVQEMETAKRIGANVVVMVWVDGEYGSIRWKQEMHRGKHSALSFGNPDFVQLAEAFGWSGYHVFDSSQLIHTLNKAMEDTAERPSLIAVDIDYSENLKLSSRLQSLKA